MGYKVKNEQQSTLANFWKIAYAWKELQGMYQFGQGKKCSAN